VDSTDDDPFQSKVVEARFSLVPDTEGLISKWNDEWQPYVESWFKLLALGLYLDDLALYCEVSLDAELNEGDFLFMGVEDHQADNGSSYMTWFRWTNGEAEFKSYDG